MQHARQALIKSSNRRSTESWQGNAILLSCWSPKQGRPPPDGPSIVLEKQGNFRAESCWNSNALSKPLANLALCPLHTGQTGTRSLGRERCSRLECKPKVKRSSEGPRHSTPIGVLAIARAAEHG